MALASTVDSLDDVAEAFRGEYKPAKIKNRDGTERDVFALDVTDVEAHPGVTRLVTALSRTKEEKARLSTDLTALKSKLTGFGDDFDFTKFDAEKWQAFIDHLENDDDPSDPKAKERREAASKQVQILEQRITRLTADNTKMVEAKDKEIGSLNSYINRLLIDDGLTKELMENGVAPKFLKAAKSMLRDQCEVEVDGEERTAVFKDAAGSIPIQKFVKDWAAGDEGREFVDKAAGSGAQGSDVSKQRTKGPNPFEKGKENLTAQGQLISSNPAEAKRLLAEAKWSDDEISRRFPTLKDAKAA